MAIIGNNLLPWLIVLYLQLSSYGTKGTTSVYIYTCMLYVYFYQQSAFHVVYRYGVNFHKQSAFQVVYGYGVKCNK